MILSTEIEDACAIGKRTCALLFSLMGACNVLE
jgi:hypothetical protein